MVRSILAYVALALLIFVMGAPTLWMIVTAFKAKEAVVTTDLLYLGKQWPIFDNFNEVATRWTFLPRLRDSFIVAGANTLLCMLLGIPAAYVFARRKFRGSKALQTYILSFRFLPPVTVAIPLFILFSYWGLIDTYQGLIIAHLLFNLPLVIWLLKGFFQDIPKEVDESAMVDGCSVLGAIVRIILPIAKTGIVVCGIFAFIFSWNEFIMALLLTRTAVKTVPIGIAAFLGGFGVAIEWHLVCAAVLTYVLPMFFFILVLQKYIVRGLTMGAVKA